MPDNQNTTPTYREEIEAALSDDTTQIGAVFREMREDGNKGAQDIADALRLGTSPVYASLSSIETLLDGRIVVGTASYADIKARMLRGFYKRHERNLSDATKQRLVALAGEHETFASRNMEEERSRENAEIELREREWTQINVPGVYVYTYPHYKRFPVLTTDNPDTSPRTFLKIGKSDRDMAKRIASQNRTSMPESPLVLRMYGVPPNGNTVDEIEKTIHSHLNAADHNRNTQKGAGTEWFLTHLSFVDSTASLLGLEELYRHAEDE